ncbi:MAG: hypothetical protein Kapaf2KO_22880 [Candidatus Kapaibacteriales bacterium]
MVRNLDNPLIMGILNATPDSFSDGGYFFSIENAIKHIETLVTEGADIIDIGGESTRPGSERVPLVEEEKRVLPLLREVKKNFDIKISIDSYKYELQQKACDIGIDYINDVSMLKDKRLAFLSKEFDIPIIIMHTQGDPKTMQMNPEYTTNGVFFDVNEELVKVAEEATELGAKEVILDPGIGFGKTVQHNLSLIRNIERLGDGRYRTLLGLSRKSFINKLNGTEETQERDIETVALHSYTHGKSDIVRVHNVGYHKRAWNLINGLNEVD